MKISNPADGTVITEVTADNATAVRRKYELARAGQSKWAKVPLKKILDTPESHAELQRLAEALRHVSASWPCRKRWPGR